MKQVISQYGKFLIEGIVLMALLILLFAGIKDSDGNQGVPRMIGARLPTGGINYDSYNDFNFYHAESSKENPKIEFGGESLAVGVIKLSDHIHATDYSGAALSIRVIEIRSPDGSDITGAMAADTTVSLDVPGIYTVRLRAMDAGGRKTVSTVNVAVNK